MLLLIFFVILVLVLFGGLGILLHPLFLLGLLLILLAGGFGWFGHRHY